MQTTLYSATIPTFIRSLTALKGVLAKAAAHAKEQGIDPNEYLTKQLAPDMFPLSRQVQGTCDAARLLSYRLTGTEAPSVPDTETTFDELHARIDLTLKALGEVSEEEINHTEDAEVRNKYIPGKKFSGFGYATGYTIPNFFFHLTTAYAILRNQGVPLGKTDYLGTLPLTDD